MQLASSREKTRRQIRNLNADICNGQAYVCIRQAYKVASIISEDHPRQKNNRVGISPVSRNELTVIQRFRHWSELWKIELIAVTCDLVLYVSTYDHLEDER